ncbi:hypothetical protein CHELA20_11335 [Hyphomicrobiales bacterium]|nr:hypothetical protein CHELA20_11335 [Hyphomicrobiales bacterium]CAH1695659.1 hypothetical protein CHELA41_51583 [Hyphomicrobiales bacterium]
MDRADGPAKATRHHGFLIAQVDIIREVPTHRSSTHPRLAAAKGALGDETTFSNAPRSKPSALFKCSRLDFCPD